MEALAPIFSFFASAGPALGGISSAIGLGENLFGGGDKGSGASAPAPATSTPVSAGPTASSSPALPGTTPDDFKKQQNAYYQQMLAGMGQGQEGGGLPPGIADMIEKQASLIK